MPSGENRWLGGLLFVVLLGRFLGILFGFLLVVLLGLLGILFALGPEFDTSNLRSHNTLGCNV